MINNPAYWVTVPAEVRYSKDLSQTQKLLYAEISTLSNKEGYCWISNKKLAKYFSMTEGHISKCINHMVKRGFIKTEIDKEKGNYRKIWILSSPITIPMVINDYTYGDKSLDPMVIENHSYSEKSPYNNIYNNTVNNITNTDPPKVKKPAKQTEHFEEELEIFINNFNVVYKSKFRVPKGNSGWIPNYKKWRETYSLDEINTAVTNSKSHSFYRDKLNPDMLFRIKDDKIGTFLQLKTAEEHLAYKEKASIKFMEIWKDVI